jgi:uncharacterized protein (TIGR02996 family)
VEDESAFLNALIDCPESDCHRAVYADWLEERGDARAGFVRLLLAVRSLPLNTPALEAAQRQLRELRTQLSLTWLRAVEPLARLGPLSRRTLSWVRHAARRHGSITTLGELCELTEEEVLELRGFAETPLRELRDRLAALGLSFRSPDRARCVVGSGGAAEGA